MIHSYYIPYTEFLTALFDKLQTELSVSIYSSAQSSSMPFRHMGQSWYCAMHFRSQLGGGDF